MTKPSDNTNSIPQKLASVVGIAVLVLFGANEFVRVSDGTSSHGIVEEWVFGRAILSSVLTTGKSENRERYERSSELSGRIAQTLTSHGASLLTDSSLEEKRKETARMAQSAYELSSKISAEHLRASNHELPEMYTKHFVEAMRLWADGLSQRRTDQIESGITHYNSFLNWIQSKDRSDFQNVR